MLATTFYQNDNADYFPQSANDTDIKNPADMSKALWFNALDFYLKLDTGNDASGAPKRNDHEIKQDPVWSGFSKDEQ
jgi:hypothetical protein